MLTSRGGVKGDQEASLPAPAPFASTLPVPARSARAGSAGSRGKLRELRPALSLPWPRCAGARGNCRADFQQRGSAPALPAEQTPRSRTHFSPQGGPGSCSASPAAAFSRGERSLSGTPAAVGRSLGAAAARPSPVRREAPAAFPTCGQKTTFFTITSSLLSHTPFFSFFFFILILFIPPVTVCGK